MHCDQSPGAMTRSPSVPLATCERSDKLTSCSADEHVRIARRSIRQRQWHGGPAISEPGGRGGRGVGVKPRSRWQPLSNIPLRRGLKPYFVQPRYFGGSLYMPPSGKVSDAATRERALMLDIIVLGSRLARPCSSWHGGFQGIAGGWSENPTRQLRLVLTIEPCRGSPTTPLFRRTRFFPAI